MANNKTIAEKIRDAVGTGKDPSELDGVTVSGAANLTKSERIMISVGIGRTPDEWVDSNIGNITLPEAIDLDAGTGEDPETLAAELVTGYEMTVHAFSGTTIRIPSLSGVTENGKLLLSFWINAPSASYAAGQGIYAMDTAGGNEFTFLQNDNTVDWEFYSGDFSKSLVFAPTLVPDALTHVVANLDFNKAVGTKTVQCYVNDVSSTGSIIDGDAAFVMTINGKDFVLGGDDEPVVFPLTGSIGDFYYAPGQELDLSIEANRRKFIDAEGNPVSLGADGSTPTGVAPAVYFSGNNEDATAFTVNRGTGGAVA